MPTERREQDTIRPDREIPAWRGPTSFAVAALVALLLPVAPTSAGSMVAGARDVEPAGLYPACVGPWQRLAATTAGFRTVPARAAGPAHLGPLLITARLSADLRVITGAVTAAFSCGKRPAPRLFWLYSNLHSRPHPALTDATEANRYPVGFNPGSTKVLGVGSPMSKRAVFRWRYRDHPRLGRRTLLEVDRVCGPGVKGRAVAVRVSFRTLIPEKYGPFGRSSKGVSLSGGWYPVPVGVRNGRPALDGKLPAAPVLLRLTLPAGAQGLVGAAPTVRGKPTVLEGRYGQIPVRLTSGGRWSSATVGRTTLRLFHTAGRAEKEPRVPRTPARDPTAVAGHIGRLPRGLLAEDWPGDLLAAAGRAIRFLSRRGVTPVSGRLLLVETPLRTSLTHGTEAGLWVSDLALKTMPALRVRLFQEVRLVRGIAAHILRRRLLVAPGGRRPAGRGGRVGAGGGPRGGPTPSSVPPPVTAPAPTTGGKQRLTPANAPDWLVEMMATFLAEKYRRRATAAIVKRSGRRPSSRRSRPKPGTKKRSKGAEDSAFNLLGWASWHPRVDSFLYDPRGAFAALYFPGPGEEDRFRDGPGRAHIGGPTGRRVYFRLRAALGPRATDRLLSRMLTNPQSPLSMLRRALDGIYGKAGAFLLGAWASATRSPDYRRGPEVVSTLPRKPLEGRRQGGPHVRGAPVRTMRIDAIGKLVPEVVELAIGGGAGRRAVRLCAGRRRYRIPLTQAAGPDSLVIDPRGRLDERPGGSKAHPKGNNAPRGPIKLILYGFEAYLLASEERLAFSASVGLQRKYDLRNSLVLSGYSGPISWGGSISFSRGLGRRRTIASLTHRLGAYLSLSMPHESAGTAAGSWTDLAVGGTWYHNTRRSRVNPTSGETAGAGLRLSFAWQGDRRKLYLTGSARGLILRRVASRVVLAARLEAAAIVGEAPQWRLLHVGGRFAARGYRSDEHSGRYSALGGLEVRVLLTRDLAVPILLAARLRGIQLAFFGEVGALAGLPDSPTPVLFLPDLGLGLRVHFDWLHVAPGVLAIDFAVPFGRRGRGIGGHDPAVYVYFGQSFTLF